MKGKLAAFSLAAISIAWISLRGVPENDKCRLCFPSPDSVILPPTPTPTPPSLTSQVPSSYPPPPSPDEWKAKSADERLADLRQRVLEPLGRTLEDRHLKLGNAVYIRAFKESRELELWLHTGSEWTLFRTYAIAGMSGTLGPKLAEGDGQAPEGFYSATTRRLNPASNYHLAFNIGYPNAYDLHHQRTGSLIMVHGSNVSIGCLAMTDPVIEEIYILVSAALQAKQKEVPVHLFPFRMTAARMEAAQTSPHLPFWQELKPAYDWFETHRRPPAMTLHDGHYAIQASNASADQ